MKKRLSKSRRVLIFGGRGLVGRELVGGCFKMDSIFSPPSKALNITCLKEVRQAVKNIKPDVVVNLAAYTDVDGAEEHNFDAFIVNGIGAENVALCSAEVKANLIHMSTDYVFSGDISRPYKSSDKPKPGCVYGWSKLDGEQRVSLVRERFNGSSLIVRTSWVFGKYKNSFPEAILRKAMDPNRDEIEVMPVVVDQVGSPTLAWDLARFIEEISFGEISGILHFSNKGFCSRYDQARHIMKCAHELTGKSCFKPSRIVKTHTCVLPPKPAKRPEYSVLDLSCLDGFIKNKYMTWKSAIRFHVSELVSGGFFSK